MLTNELNSYYEKQKLSKKLNKKDSEKVIEILINYLQTSELNIEVMDLLMTFLPDVGINAFVKYLKDQELNKCIESLDFILNSKEFLENLTNKSVKRGLALAAFLNNENFDPHLVKKTITKTTEIAITTSKTGINSKIIESTLNEFSKRIKQEFYTDDDMVFDLNDREFHFIFKTFFNSYFNNNDKFNVTAENQLNLLKWLNALGNKVHLDQDEKNNLNINISKWTPKHKEDLKNQAMEIVKFIPYINQKLEEIGKNQHDQIQDIDNKLKDNDKNNEVNNNVNNKENNKENNKIDGNTQTKLSNNIELQDHKDIKEVLNKFSQEFKFIENHILKNEIKSTKLEQNLEFYKSEHLKLNEEIENLKSKNENTLKINKELEKSKEISNIKVQELHKEIEMLTNKITGYEANIKILHETNNIIDTNSLVEFKNKLSTKLKSEYSLFNQVKNEEVDVELAEILKFKLNNIFKLLINNGIDLD